jgi:predicted DNA-binding transcriptional regulator YafY
VSIRWDELDAVFSVKASGVMAADATLFGDLLDAVTARREVSFDYLKLTSSHPEQRRVQPYHVGQIEHGWYLMAYDPSRKEMRTFVLQRMTNLRVHPTTFERDPNFSAKAHLNGGFGVWSYDERQNPAQAIRVRFEGYAARIVGERMWHSSQEIVPLEADGSVIEFRAKLSGLEEITRWVLSWGSKARVLEPASLQERVQEELRAMVKAAAER